MKTQENKNSQRNLQRIKERKKEGKQRKELHENQRNAWCKLIQKCLKKEERKSRRGENYEELKKESQREDLYEN